MTDATAFSVPTRAFAGAMAGADVVTHRPTPAAAFVRARQIMRSGERLDMARLASDLGIARATLYRWTGDRDRLLADVSWAEIELLINHIDQRTPGHGAERLQRIAGDFLSALVDNPGLRSFLANEGEHGLQLVTAPRGGVRPRIVAAVRDLITREASSGSYEPPDDPALVADGIVSLGERFLYHGGDPALNPDPNTARRVISLLLREPART